MCGSLSFFVILLRSVRSLLHLNDIYECTYNTDIQLKSGSYFCRNVEHASNKMSQGLGKVTAGLTQVVPCF